MAQVMPSLKNITWERLVREDAVTYPCDAPDKPGNEIIFAQAFPTASGRAKIVPADLRAAGRAARRRVSDGADHRPHARALAHRLDDAARRPTLDALEPEAIAGLNPREMERLGIAPGDMVTVATRRGDITLKARADRDVAEGMVFIPFGFAEAPANMLTNPQLDPFGKIPEFKFCAARVEKAGDGREAAE